MKRKFVPIVLLLAFIIIFLAEIYSNVKSSNFMKQYENILEANKLTIEVLNEDEKTVTGEDCTKLMDKIAPVMIIDSLKKDIKKCEPKEYATLKFYREDEMMGTVDVLKLSCEDALSEELEDFIYIIDGYHCVLELNNYYCGKGKSYDENFSF